MQHNTRQRRIVIIGSGFSGLCLGIQLKQAGIHTFTILEKANQLGGTWRDNTYPGAACDVPSISYCFSFEQKTDWSRKWSPQTEILAYMEHCARKYGLMPHLQFGTAVERAHFDAEAGVWHVQTASGETLTADILVSGVGQLNRPYILDIAGLETFQGEQFHSAQWNHKYDLTGKTVGVIGNAASAIQFIPQIAPHVQQLFIFQRSANWMVPKFDRAYTEAEKRWLTRSPILAKLYRWWTWGRYERLFPIFRRNRFLSKRMERVALDNMHSHISDPTLREVLTPDYPIGGKRILFSDDYYPTLERDNVEVVANGIERVTEDGIVTSDGQQRQLDALILATGFESTAFLSPMQIEGLNGRSIHTEWQNGARAYLGMTLSGFPNFFMMYGPNTNLGHNSIVFMIECQTRYIIDCIQGICSLNLKSLNLRTKVLEDYNRRTQQELQSSVWAATGKSWYKTEEGTITNNWPGTTIRYWWNTRTALLDIYEQERRRVPIRLPDMASDHTTQKARQMGVASSAAKASP